MLGKLYLVWKVIKSDTNKCFVFPQILVIIGMTHVLVVFRAIIAVIFTKGNSEFLRSNSNSGAMMLGAILHYLIITVMKRVQRSLNVHLCVL